jgi:hypothetical protein
MSERAAKIKTPSQRDRIVYATLRIRELNAELKALREEGRKLRESLRGAADRSTPEAKAMKQRLAYIAVRPIEAKAEAARLTAERKELKGASA